MILEIITVLGRFSVAGFSQMKHFIGIFYRFKKCYSTISSRFARFFRDPEVYGKVAKGHVLNFVSNHKLLKNV